MYIQFDRNVAVRSVGSFPESFIDITLLQDVMEFLVMNENNVWIPDITRLLSQHSSPNVSLREEGRAACQLHKSDSFNMLNFMR